MSKYITSNMIYRLTLFVLLAVFASNAYTSHFRFGHFTWEAKPEVSAETADFRMTVAFRSSYFGNPDIGQVFRPGSFNFGDGTSTSYSFEVIARNLQEDWIVGRAVESGTDGGFIRHTYPSANNNGSSWMANFTSCCKIGSLRNAASGSWRVNTSVDLSDGNSSPFSNLPPIVSCGKFDCRFNIPAVDPDGDQLAFRLATNAESAIRSIPAGIEIDSSTGLFTWNEAEAFTNGLYSIQVIIEDRDDNGGIKSNVAIDFIVNLQEQGTNAWPVFDVPPTPQSNSTITTVVGQPLDIVVQATDPDPGDEVFLNHVGLPDGATFEQTVSGGATGTGRLRWTPASADVGQHIVTFLANDSRGGASPPTPVTIDVINPAISNVRVVSTISTSDISIDAASYSQPPASVSIENDHTVITWEFPTYDVGQIAELDTTIKLFSLKPGEQRVVTEKLELFYNDIDGQPVYELLDEQRITVAPSYTTIGVDTDEHIYSPGQTVNISSLLRNLSSVAVDADVELEIRDSQGATVSFIGNFEENDIAPFEQRALLPVQFDTNGVYAGAYEVVATLREAGGLTSIASTPFALTTQNGELLNVASLVRTSKPAYSRWDIVTLELRALNLSRNAAFDGGKGTLLVVDPAGDTVERKIFTINSLTPEAVRDRQHVLTLDDAIPGEYRVSWSISSGDAALYESRTTFTVGDNELEALVGGVAISKYPTGEAEICSFETANRSIAEIKANLVYQLVNLDTGNLVFETHENSVFLAGSQPHSYQFMLGDPPAYGEFGCVLMAEIDGVSSQLAATGFEVVPPSVQTSLYTAARGKLLVLVDSDLGGTGTSSKDRNDAIEQRAYLEFMLLTNGWDYTLTENAGDFAAAFYSGEYGSIAILSENVKLDSNLQGLLVEAHFGGVGLLIAGGDNRRNYQIEKSIGIELNGQNVSPGSINLLDGLIEEPSSYSAPVDSGLNLTHCSAQVWATFTNGRSSNSACDQASAPAAISGGDFGNGKNTFFAYDLLDESTTHGDLHEQAFAKALDYIQPDTWPTGQGRTIPVKFHIENQSRKAAVEALISVTEPALLRESELPLQLTAGIFQWQLDFSAPGDASNTMYIQLPEVPSGPVYIEADVNAGFNREHVVDIAEVQLLLSNGTLQAPSLEVSRLASSLAVSGSGVARQRNIVKHVEDAKFRLARAEITKAISSLLKASDELSSDSSDHAKALRLAIDDWLFVLKPQLFGENE